MGIVGKEREARQDAVSVRGHRSDAPTKAKLRRLLFVELD